MDNYMVIGYPQTTAENAASITPTNYGYPELYFERYGGGVSATSTVNDAAMTSALAVATNRGGGFIFRPRGLMRSLAHFRCPGVSLFKGLGPRRF